MKINRTQFDTWIQALRSGEFKQGRGQLEGAEGFCCMGTACKVLVPEYQTLDGMLVGGFPRRGRGAPKWLTEISKDFALKKLSYLEELNDNAGATFDEIADLLEAVYIHQVLD